VTFRDAVHATPEIAQHYCEGLQGVKGEHRGKMHKSRQYEYRGSVDLDAALQARYPNEPRWDYAIGFGPAAKSDAVAYVEVHSARSTHVDDVIKKKAWLVAWMRTSAPSLNRLSPREFHWVFTDGTSIRAGTPQRNRLAAEGIWPDKIAKIGRSL